jgi:hypothetical protein
VATVFVATLVELGKKRELYHYAHQLVRLWLLELDSRFPLTFSADDACLGGRLSEESNCMVHGRVLLPRHREV